MRKGFTLIELLVVVLIIGILSAVALPQYTIAVEKSRMAEALINMKVIMDAYDRYEMAGGGDANFRDYSDVELTGGEWTDNGVYVTKNFRYGPPNSSDLTLEIIRSDHSYYLEASKSKSRINCTNGTNGWCKRCSTQLTDKGRKICKGLESQGFIYSDDEK